MSLDEIIQQEQGRIQTMRKKYEQILYTTDHHYPYTDRGMMKVEKAILKEEKPKYHVMGGDSIDASGLSSFAPNAKYIDETQTEIDGFALYLAELHAASPNTKRIIIYGNHDWARLERAKAETPFGLAGLRVLTYEKLFKEAAEFHGVDIGKPIFAMDYMIGPGIKFVHGDARMDKRLKGGVTGIRRTVSEYPGDFHIVMGHGHRQQLGRHPWSSREVHMVGAMMDTDQVCYAPFSQYENGLAMIQYSPKSRPNPVYHIQNVKRGANGDMIVNGKVYNGKR